jgi:hypothetical protein
MLQTLDGISSIVHIDLLVESQFFELAIERWIIACADEVWKGAGLVRETILRILERESIGDLPPRRSMTDPLQLLVSDGFCTKTESKLNAKC